MFLIPFAITNSMKENTIQQKITALYESWAGEQVTSILPLTRTASNRSYFRITSATKKAIGTYGPDPKENTAFVSFTKSFYQKGLPVPELYAENLSEQIYIQEDLGGTTLYRFLQENKDGFSESSMEMYKKVLAGLARMQVEGTKDLDYSVAYPRPDFDRQSMQWDLNGFKYFFLKLSGLTFDEQALEKDFDTLIDFLLSADRTYFMYRDFQARNIMLKDGEPYFIDYQGGRRGALHYDPASLLFQPKAAIPFAIREELMSYYLDVIAEMIPVDREKFMDHFYGYVMIRRIQAFGTYGQRGLHERLAYFINGLPIALQDIKWVLDNKELPIEIPELLRVLRLAIEDPRFQPAGKQTDNKFLTVRVNSFSYKFSHPEDPSGNGGGFVFDCRFINNPGRYEPYKKLTGRDEPVIKFLKENSNIADYLNNIYHIVDEAVENYIERKFTSLMVNFGCTGGQHRSVYAADMLAAHLEQKYGVNVELKHIRQEEKNWVN
jgi:aminoglycoside/choline kinase family phosphotransferase